jgi:hypothetical protein
VELIKVLKINLESLDVLDLHLILAKVYLRFLNAKWLKIACIANIHAFDLASFTIIAILLPLELFSIAMYRATHQSIYAYLFSYSCVMMVLAITLDSILHAIGSIFRPKWYNRLDPKQRTASQP